MSSKHHITRDVIINTVYVDDPNDGPLTTEDPTLRPMIGDQRGVPYVIALGAGPDGLTSIPIGELGVTQGPGNQAVVGMASPLLWSGPTDNNYNRQGAAVAGNMNPVPGSGPSASTALVTPPAEWGSANTPAVGARATASRVAAGAGVRHICKSITATLSVPTADVGVAGSVLQLRDGATGTGTILWTCRLSVVDAAGGFVSIVLPNINIAGTANTAMTLEFLAAPGGASMQTVAMTGYTANAS